MALGRVTRACCPSASIDAVDAEILGVVRADGVAYLAERAPVTPELRAATQAIGAARVLRIAAPCAESACSHYTAARCSLVDRIVDQQPFAASELGPCILRKRCVWFAQRGRSACEQCPKVVTAVSVEQPALVAIARPPTH